MQPFLIKICLVLAVLIGACGITWVLADKHYSAKYDELTAKLAQEATDQKVAYDKEVVAQKTITENIQHEAQAQLATAGSTINDLTSRLQHTGSRTITVSTPTSTTCSAGSPTIGQTVTASAGQPQATTGSTASLDEQTLTDVLDVGIQALEAEILWRQWSREIGEVK